MNGETGSERGLPMHHFQYHAIVGNDRPWHSPYAVFRHKPGVWEIWRDGGWHDEPGLMEYTHHGEVGAEPISEAAALEMCRQKGASA